MKKFFGVVCMLCVVGQLSAQVRMKKSDLDKIKSDTTYYWGENAVVSSQNEAFDLSLNSLYENIANNCGADAIYAGVEDQKTQMLAVIRTYENKIKEKTIQIPIVDDFMDDEYSYFVYLKRSDFRDMCKERAKSIERLALRGYNSENDENLQLEDALKSYYWGMMLCLAHPYGNNLKIKVGEEMVKPYDWFIDRIDGVDGVLKSFSFIVPKENAFEKTPEGMIINLNVRSTFGLPISNLQFQYYNGQKYVPSSVNDGKAVVIVKQNDNQQLNIRIEYEFRNESTIDPEVYKVLHTIRHNIRFKNVKHVVNLNNHDNVKASEETQTEHAKEAEKEWRKIDAKFDVNQTDYMKIMKEVESALRAKNHESVKHLFTDEGFGMLDTLTKYGNITVVGKQDYKFIKIDEQVICRDINMQFDFRNQVSFNRDVVFRFDHNTKKITSIAFRLSSVTEEDIISKIKWSEESRLVLVNFLEDYQTAYALKRLDYLESIYSDDALIIVGHVVKKTVIPDRAEFNLTEEEVRLMQYDKNTYFSNLSRTFKSQEYINIRFADTDFTKAKSDTGKEVYGVRLLQEYYSTTYGDIGYLFLLVDVTDDKPLIHVRAWQPDEVELEKLMGMKDMRF